MSGGKTRRASVFFAGVLGVLWLVATGVALFDFLRVSPEVPNHGPCVGTDGLREAAPRFDPGGAIVEVARTRLLGDPGESGLGRWPGLFDAAPATFDLDGDGTDEVLATSNDTHVYVFHADGGKPLAALPLSCPAGWFIERVLNRADAGVLRPGDPPSVVTTSPAAFVAAWTLVPDESSGGGYVFEKRWERRAADCFWNSGMDAKATLADADGDGTLEVFVQTEEVGLFALNADGRPRWHHCWAGGNSEPVVDDLDGDGRPEAIFASDSGFLSVLDADTGKPLWTFDAASQAYGVAPASISVRPTVAEMDGVPPKEILFTARHAPREDPAAYGSFHMAIFAVHQSPVTWQAELVWLRQPEWAHPLSYTPLVVDDVDGDGYPEIFGMDWNTVGHSPGQWEPLGNAHLFRLDARGEDVWVREIEAWWSNKDVALGDVDGDGAPDLVVNGVRAGEDGLAIIAAGNGETLDFLSTAPWKIMRGPLLLDLRHDGSTQVAVAVAPDKGSRASGAVLILDLERAPPRHLA